MSSGIDRSSGIGKWGIEDHRNIDRALRIARSSAYYVEERQLPARQPPPPPPQPFFLRCLLQSRLHDDELERRKILTSFPSKSADQSNRMKDMQQLKGMDAMEQSIRLFKYAECCTPANSLNTDNVPKLSILCLDVIAANLGGYHPETIKYLTDYLLSDDSSTYLSIKSSQYGTLNDSNIAVAANSDCRLIVLGEFVTMVGVKLLFENCGELYFNNDELATADDWEEFDPDSIQFRQLYTYLEELYFMGTQLDAESLALIGKNAPNIMKLHLHNIKEDGNSSKGPHIVHNQQQYFSSNSSDGKNYCISILTTLLEGFHSLVFLEISYCDWISIQNLNLWRNAIYHGRNRSSDGCCILPSLKCVHILGWKTYQEEALKITSENKQQGMLACEQHEVECSNIIQIFQDSCDITLIIE